jgi:hypothetical protein
LRPLSLDLVIDDAQVSLTASFATKAMGGAQRESVVDLERHPRATAVGGANVFQAGALGERSSSNAGVHSSGAMIATFFVRAYPLWEYATVFSA